MSNNYNYTDTTPYLLRQTGNGDITVYGTNREDDTLVGATVRVNQILDNMRVSGTEKGLTFTRSENGLSISGTITEAFNYNYVIFTNTVYIKRDGRKYLFLLSKPIPYGWGLGGYGETFSSNATGGIFTNNAGTDWNNGLVFRAKVGETIEIQNLKACIIDLTAMFGSTIADYLYSLETATTGAGIAKLKEWGFITGEYIPYNAGTLESVEARSHVMTGKNIFGGLKMAQDIVDAVPNTTLNETDKTVSYSAAHITGKTLYKFPDPNTQYTIIMQGHNTSSGATATNIAIRYEGGVVVGLSPLVDGVSITITSSSRKIESLVGTWSTGGTVLYYEKCGVFRGVIDESQFEPYVSHTYDLGTDTLRGLFKLDSNNNLYADGDTKTSDGVITRKYKVVTYDGSEAWVQDRDANSYNRYYIADNSVKVLSDYRDNIVNSKGYSIAASYAFANAGLGDIAFSAYSIAGSSNWVYIGLKTSLNISTLADFKAWLANNPVIVVLPLATPTTEQSTPFTNPQICDPDGTEEYVSNNGVPVGHETEYDYDIKGLAEGLIDVPDVPSTNGTYVLKATRSASGISYEWVSST